VNSIRDSLAPFLLVSTAFHLLLVLSWYGRHDRQTIPDPIRVTVIPPVEQRKQAAPPPRALPAPKPFRDSPTPAELPPGQPAKKSRPGAEAPGKTPGQVTKENQINERLATSKTTTVENGIAIDRELPTLKDLLEPIYRPFSEGNRGEPIRLDSRDPKHVGYLKRIHHAIDMAWRNPEVAKSAAMSYGFEGTAVVQFRIGQSGQLEDIHLLRSSGYAILDQEVIRVVQAAAPHFGVIPRLIGKSEVLIDATFIYENETLTYDFGSATTDDKTSTKTRSR
jgi:TonB family protein